MESTDKTNMCISKFIEWITRIQIQRDIILMKPYVTKRSRWNQNKYQMEFNTWIASQYRCTAYPPFSPSPLQSHSKNLSPIHFRQSHTVNYSPRFFSRPRKGKGKGKGKGNGLYRGWEREHEHWEHWRSQFPPYWLVAEDQKGES